MESLDLLFAKLSLRRSRCSFNLVARSLWYSAACLSPGLYNSLLFLCNPRTLPLKCQWSYKPLYFWSFTHFLPCKTTKNYYYRFTFQTSYNMHLPLSLNIPAWPPLTTIHNIQINTHRIIMSVFFKPFLSTALCSGRKKRRCRGWCKRKVRCTINLNYCCL